MREVFKLSEPQQTVEASRRHLILDMGGQRAGKTHLIGFNSGIKVTNYPRINGFIGANTDQQLSKTTIRNVKAIWRSEFGYEQFDKIKNPRGVYVVDKIPPPHFERYQEPKSYYNTISFQNGALVYLGSLKNYLAHDGLEFGWAHLDEVADTKEEAVKNVILARLSQPGLYFDPLGRLVYFDGTRYLNDEFKEFSGDLESLEPFNPCYFHTSPKHGTTEWLISMFKLSGREEEIKRAIMAPGSFFHQVQGTTETVIYSTHHNAENLQKNYIKNREAELTEIEQIKYIYGYPFSKTGGEFYPSFDRLIHTGKVKFIPELPLHISFDFNVLPYMTAICIQVLVVKRWKNEKLGVYLETPERNSKGEIPEDWIETDVLQIRFFKEFCLKTPLNTTSGICQAIIETFSDYNPDVFYYGDASGKSRQPGHGEGTNFKTIASLLWKFINNSSDRVPKANPSIFKRRDFIERMLNKKYPIELLIDAEDCPETVKDFEFVKLGSEGKHKELVKDSNGISYQKAGHCTDGVEYFIVEFFKELYKQSV